jgi:hypothetical protein
VRKARGRAKLSLALQKITFLFWVEKDASEEQEDPNPAELTHIELQIETRKEYTFHRYWVGWEL